MPEVEIYCKPETPLNGLPEMLVVEGDFSRYFITEELNEIDKRWERRENKGLTSRPKSLASLIGAVFGRGLTFVTTEYKMYRASTELGIPKLNLMRVGSVGGAVKSKEGDVIVHKRPANAGHVPNIYDASVGGFCILQNLNLNPIDSIYQKLKRELKIEQGHIKNLRWSDFHHASAPDHSGMFSFVVETLLETSELKERGEEAISRGEFGGIEIVNQNELPNFIIQNYGGTNHEKRNGTLDGAIVLASSLPPREGKYTISKLIKSGVDIQFGKLIGNRFIPKK